MNQTMKRTLSMLLTLAMLFSMVGLNTAFATEGDAGPADGTITAFSALEETTARQTVPQGTEITDLTLPETLSATGAQDAAGAETALPVTWACQEYDPAAQVGTAFTFAPEWDKDTYPLGDEVAAPTITVTLTETPMPRGATSKTVNDIDALNDAVTSVTDGGTIQLTENITGTMKIESTNNKSFTLDLNGFALNGNSGRAITHEGSGKLTIINTGGNASGKVTSANTFATGGTIYLAGATTGTVLSVEGGTVENTNDSIAIYNHAAGEIFVSGGTVKATGENGTAIYNNAAGKITISGSGTMVTSENTGSLSTIHLNGGTSGNTVLSVQGGTVESTAAGDAIYNANAGTVTVSGGTVKNTGGGPTIHNAAGGAISVSGGTVRSTGSRAIYNAGAGKITVKGSGTLVTSANTGGNGTIYLAGGASSDTVLSVEGGTVENTGSGNAIYNNAAGAISVSGGTVKNTANGNAIYNNAAGTVSFSGGEVKATTGKAIFNVAAGKITVSGGTVSVTDGNAIYNVATGTVTVSGGTVSVTGNDKGAIYNLDAGVIVVDGGSIKSIVKGSGSLKNTSGADLQRYDLTLGGVNRVVPVTSIAITPAYTYGYTGVQTDATGKLYVWLPTTTATSTAVTVITADGTYKGTLHTQEETLSVVNPLQITVPLDFNNTTADCSCINYNDGNNTLGHTHPEGNYCFTWTKSTLTLTLNNLNLETASVNAISLLAGGVLVMEGTSTVTNTLDGENTGIYADGPLTLRGSGSLTVTTADTTNSNSTGIQAGSITMESGTLTVTPGNTGNSGNAGESCGIYIRDAAGFTQTGGTLTANGGTSNSVSYGIDANGKAFKLTGGTLTATGGTARTSYGVHATGSFTLSGGKITAKSLGTGANNQPFNRAPTLLGGMVRTSTTTWDNQTGAACTYEGPPIALVTGVTLNKNALTLYSNTAPKEETLVATVTPADANDKSVTWSSSNTAVATVDANGKVVAVANGTAVITATTNSGGKTASCTVTVSTYSSGGSGDSGSSGGSGSSGSGGSSTIITPPSTVEQPKPPATAETKAPATVDKNGNATVSVPEKSVTDAIKAAQDDAKKNGTTANGIAVVIDTTTGKGAGSIAATLPKAAVDALIAAGVTEVTIKSDAANITLDLATLKAIQAAAGDNVTISAQPVKASTLSAEAQAAIGSRPVFNLSITAGGKAVTGFGGGSVSVALPYTPAAGENTAGLYGVYVDAAGKVTYLQSSSYDANAKMMRFSTGHFSVFGIGYKAPVTFTDITTHWAKTDIEFVAGRGILSGTGNNQFSPNTGMTRGMFVTALGRLSGIDSAKYKNTKFTDVPATAYYAPYVAWASEKGITSGTTDTTFAPDRTITRQELAVLMQNYAKAMGYTVPKTREEVKFADAASIGAFATDAVKAMQMAGVMNGKNGGKFDPTGTATRAEVAAVLHRYVELVIDIQTAQGLDTNDSGSAMMYENGKLVKSASRTVGGNTYSFNSNGEAALPPTKKAGTYTVQKGDSFWLIAKKVGCTMADLELLNGKSRNDFIYTGMVLKVPVK